MKFTCLNFRQNSLGFPFSMTVNRKPNDRTCSKFDSSSLAAGWLKLCSFSRERRNQKATVLLINSRILKYNGNSRSFYIAYIIDKKIRNNSNSLKYSSTPSFPLRHYLLVQIDFDYNIVKNNHVQLNLIPMVYIYIDVIFENQYYISFSGSFQP